MKRLAALAVSSVALSFWTLGYVMGAARVMDQIESVVAGSTNHTVLRCELELIPDLAPPRLESAPSSAQGTTL